RLSNTSLMVGHRAAIRLELISSTDLPLCCPAGIPLYEANSSFIQTNLSWLSSTARPNESSWLICLSVCNDFCKKPLSEKCSDFFGHIFFSSKATGMGRHLLPKVFMAKI